MKSMRHCLFILCCFTSYGLYSQILSPVSLNCMGRSLNNGNLIIEDNLGSLEISTIATPTFVYTQGFIQPDAGTTNEVPHINDISLGAGSYLLDVMGGTITQFEDDLMLEYSLGEVVSKTQAISTHLLTQGVLQPYIGKYWTGLVSTAWKEKNNWSPAIEPTLEDDVIIPPLCPNYPIIASGKIGSCRNILMMEGTALLIKAGGTLFVQN